MTKKKWPNNELILWRISFAHSFVLTTSLLSHQSRLTDGKPC